MSTISTSTPKQVLQEVFGFEDFRPLQNEIIQSVLNKNDTLAIMPTGGGKSLCYQIPALVFDGLTVVVSPLISLMKDQVDQLRAYGIAAAYLNSTLSLEDYQHTTSQIRNRELDLIYLAPETLMKSSTMQLLKSQQVDLFAIDEAHCISEWGHDFRPEYRQLSQVNNHFPQAVCLALTATATPQVQQDIATTLEMDSNQVYVASFDRDNLFLDIVQKQNPLQQVIDFLNDHKEESGIIYCFSRRQVDDLSLDLNHHGFKALPYHAGLSEDERASNQEAFIKDEIPVIVATIAFGMGIDKPDVRFVVHHDMPKNIESYYQQIGRAGRDGLHADCLFLFSYGDVGKIRYFIDQKEGQEQQVANQHLEDLLRFVESRICRRKPLLKYFGETYHSDDCEMCDICIGEDQETEDITIPAQKFLSTMVRTNQRFGFQHIKHILTGSKRKRILQLGHHELSTYGIGTEYSNEQWKQLYRELMNQEIINRHPEHGNLILEEPAVSVLKGKQKVFGLIEEDISHHKSGGSKSDIESLDYDRELFRRLKDKRKEMAREQGVPPYVIFPDTTLIEMAYYYPQSHNNLLEIHGVGKVKRRKFGDAFADLIIDYCREFGIEERLKNSSSLARSTVSVSSGKRYQVIGRAFNRGKSVPQLCEEYQVKTSTILNHLTSYVESGYELDQPEQLQKLSGLHRKDLKRVEQAFIEHGLDLLRPVYDALDQTVSYDELRLIRLYLKARKA